MKSQSASKTPPSFDPKVLSRLEGLEWKARYVMEGFLSGLHASPFHGLSVEFRDYRDYQPGDDLRRVDWRLYARSDRLCIKRYEQETNARCYLLCDTSASMSYRGASAWGSKMDCARALSLALGWLLLKQNDAVGLVALDPASTEPNRGDGSSSRSEDATRARYVRPSQKPHQAGVLLRELTALTPLGGPRLADLLDRTARIIQRRSLIVLFTDLIEPPEALERVLRRLRFEGHECTCIQVLDRDEIEFPFDGSLVFEDVESGLRRRVDAPRVRETYRARFERYMDGHRRLLKDLEIPHAVIRTDEDPGRALARAVASRRRVA